MQNSIRSYNNELEQTVPKLYPDPDLCFVQSIIAGDYLQGGAPPVISLFINPINYRYNPHKP